MNIEYVFGNLLDSPERVIAHGCNAKGIMASGVAKDIRARYPDAFWDYWRVYSEYGLSLGQVIITEYPERTILNIISQNAYGRNLFTRYVSYDAIAIAIEKINLMDYNRVAFPMIGAGLANGNWKVISAIIESYSDFTPVVYYIDEGLREEFGG